MRKRERRARRRPGRDPRFPPSLLRAVPLLALPLLANGGTPRVVDRSIGAYRVSVYTDPTPARPDSLDVSVLVVDEAGAAPLAGLEILVRARRIGALEGDEGGELSEGGRTTDRTPDAAEREGGPDGTAPSRALTRRATREEADDPRYYAAKFRPGEAGVWRIEVEIEGPDGAGTVDFDVRLREPGLLERPWVILTLSLLPLLALTWWLLRGDPAAMSGGATGEDGRSGDAPPDAASPSRRP